jgi:hypothetical protein
VEQFKYLGTVITNQNSVQEEIKRRLMSGNAFSAESFVFHLSIQKFKDQDIQNYNFACCCEWV